MNITPELLLYGGIAICATAVLGAIITALLLWLTKSRLNKRLDNEFGRIGR